MPVELYRIVAARLQSDFKQVDMPSFARLRRMLGISSSSVSDAPHDNTALPGMRLRLRTVLRSIEANANSRPCDFRPFQK